MAQLRMQWPPLTLNFKILAGLLFALWLASLPDSPLHPVMRQFLVLSSDSVLQDAQVWTLFSYAFFHADFMHLAFNLMVLYLFGGRIDASWSTTRWWRFNALCILGGALAVVLSQALLQSSQPTLGYSAAVTGVVAAFAVYNWDRTIYLFFFPVKGKWILPIIVGIDVLRVLSGAPISIAGHLGGMITGLLLVSGWWRPSKLKKAYRRHKRAKERQAKREQFKVLNRDPESDRRLN